MTIGVYLDDLQYRYVQYSNKLLAVTDNSPLAASGLNGTLGDFKDGSNGSADDYVYDNNGNLVIDLNKNISSLAGGAGITYNYLDKPETIHINGKGTVRITYDADGNKIARSFTPENSSTATVTTYINQFVYTETTSSGTLPPMGGGGSLSYINFEEGRLRVMQPASQTVTDNNGIVLDAVSIAGNLSLPVSGSAGTFDYFIRDYQQNVRMVLTQETHTSSSTCTIESARTTVEDAVFEAQAGGPVEQSQFAVASIPGQPWGSGQDVIHGANASKLSKLTGVTIGPNSLLKVMAGDEVSANTQYYYQNNTTNNSSNSLVTDMLASLAQALTGSSATSGTIAHGQASNIINGLNSNLPPLSSVADPNQYSGDITPRAYLNVLFFDERFNFVSENSSFVRVSSIGNENASLNLLSLRAPKNGYAYVYVSNESDEPVYFDNFKVALNRGRLIEENHYYAYGLKIAGISSRKLGSSLEGSLKNNYQYNDKELLDDGDLNWYDYGFRNYDAQIGRFVQLDPLTDDYPELTPYQYASCDPITNIDIDGLEGVTSVFKTAGDAAEFAKKSLNTVHDLDEVVVTSSRIVRFSATTINIAKEGIDVTRILKSILFFVYEGTRVLKTVNDTKGIGNVNKFLSFKNGKGNEVAYLETNNVAATMSDADIDTDGDISDVPKSERIHDASHLNSVASGQKVNPYRYNYDVLPKEIKYLKALRAHGVKMRGVYAVIYKEHISYGTNEETGPADQSTNGEFSKHQIEDMGMQVNRDGTGGVDDNSVQTIFFKNSEQHFYKDKGKPWYTGGRGNLPTLEQVNQLGQFLLNKYQSEAGKLRDYMNKNVKHVKNYD